MAIFVIFVISALLLSPVLSWPGYGRIGHVSSDEEKFHQEAYKHDQSWDDQLDGSYDLPVSSSSWGKDENEDENPKNAKISAKFSVLDNSDKTVVAARASAPKKGPSQPSSEHIATIHDEIPFYLTSDHTADIVPAPVSEDISSWKYDGKDDGQSVDGKEVEIMLGPSEPAIDSVKEIQNYHVEQSADRSAVASRSPEDEEYDRVWTEPSIPHSGDDETSEEQDNDGRSDEEEEEAITQTEISKVAPIPAPPTDGHAVSAVPVRLLSSSATASISSTPSIVHSRILKISAPAPAHLMDAQSHDVNEPISDLQLDKRSSGNGQKSAVLPVVLACVGSVLFGCVIAGVLYRRHSRHRKLIRHDAEDPAYGITGPINGKNGSLDFSGDRLLAKSAEALHFHTQKHFIQSSSVSSASTKNSPVGSGRNDSHEDELHSDYDSEEEGEEEGSDFGDYTVYECPGLAQASDSFEVINPLFSHGGMQGDHFVP